MDTGPLSIVMKLSFTVCFWLNTAVNPRLRMLSPATLHTQRFNPCNGQMYWPSESKNLCNQRLKRHHVHD